MLSRILDYMTTKPASITTLAAHIQPIMSGLLQCLDQKLQMEADPKAPAQPDTWVEKLILKIFQLVNICSPRRIS